MTPSDADFAYDFGDGEDSSDHMNRDGDVDLNSGGSVSETGSGEKDEKGQTKDKEKNNAEKDKKKDIPEKDKPGKTPSAKDYDTSDHS